MPSTPLRGARWIHRVLAVPILTFVWPTACFGCGRSLAALQQLGGCAECWSDLRPLAPPVCPTCGLPRPAGCNLLGPARGHCARCILTGRKGRLVRAGLTYDGRARSFLLRAKLGLRPELLVPLGEQLARVVCVTRFAAGCDVVVPVPSHPWVTLRRGFTPALEVARPVARRLDLELAPRALRRRLTTPRSLKRLGAGRRRTATDRGYRARGVSGARVLLIDDVMTSGATAAACCHALERAGARETRVAVWARTLPREG